MEEIPEKGWNCASCRTCTECGNRLGLGSNANSNTKDELLCSDCQRLRIKSECCICGKDTRDDSNIVKCIKCDGTVHSECQQDELTQIPIDRYHCPKCRLELTQIGAYNDLLGSNHVDDGQGSLGQGSIFTDEAGSPPAQLDLPIDPDMPIESGIEIPVIEPPKIEDDEEIIEIKPTKIDKKPISDKSSSKRVPKKGGSSISRKGSKIKSKDSTKKTSKRKAPSRAQSIDESSQGDNIVISQQNVEMANHFKTVVYDVNDDFLSKADICVACGSIGARETKESRMVHCLKCAQSYHYYCSGLKNGRIPKNGFVCLHCNDCEVCNKSTVNMERDIVACHDCNRRYHINCLKNPLPKNWRRGHSIWRCESCLQCINCGITGKECNNKFEWKNNMLTCAVCYSKEYCLQCERHFKEEELVLKCRACSRNRVFLNIKNYSFSSFGRFLKF